MDDPRNDPDSVPGYDCNDTDNERRPDHVVYTDLFEAMKINILDAFALVRDPLVQSDYQTTITKGLQREVQFRSKLGVTEEFLFAISGACGVGKSSMLNCVLGIGILARKGQSGESTTAVVQRYMKMQPGQEAPFSARVYLFSLEQIRALMASMVNKWYVNSTVETEVAQQTDEEEEAARHCERTIVLDTCLALLGDTEYFFDEEHATASLNAAESEHDGRMIECLSGMTLDAVSLGDGESFVDVSGATPEELLFNLEQYTHTPPGEAGQGRVFLWPVVNQIDISFDHPLLNEGIVLVDTPGLSDSNTTRAKSAVAHHRQCPYKIEVASIQRIKADVAMRRNLAASNRTRGSGNTMLVITRGDEYDGDTQFQGTAQEKEQEKQLQDQVKEIRKASGHLKQRKARLTHFQVDEKVDLDEEIRAVQGTLVSKVVQLDKLRLSCRNRAVESFMIQDYRKMTQDPKPLRAFVVSSEEYRTHQAGYDVRYPPKISVEETGYPALRQALYLLPAQSKLNDALHRGTVQLPALLATVECFCSRTHVGRQSRVESIVRGPKHDVPKMFGRALEKLKTQLKTILLDPMKEDEADWTSEARRLCEYWGRKHQKDHLKIMQKHGCKKGGPRVGPDIEWNVELMQIHRPEMTERMKALANAMRPLFSSLFQDIAAMMDNMRAQLKKIPQFNIMALDPLVNALQDERAGITKIMEECSRGLLRDLGDIIENVQSACPDSYMLRAMIPIYDRDGVWMAMHDALQGDCRRLFSQHFRETLTTIERIFDTIAERYEIMCNDQGARTPEEQQKEEELRAKLAKNLIVAKELLEGAIREAAERCKVYHKGGEKDQAPSQELLSIPEEGQVPVEKVE